MTREPYRSYSYEFKSAVLQTKGRKTLGHKDVPRSTIHYWKHQGIGSVQKNNIARQARIMLNTDLEFSLALQKRVSIALCNALSELAKAGTFKPKAASSIWADLRSVLGEISITELKFLLSRDIYAKISTPICENSNDGGCLKRYPHRISESEVVQMRRLVESTRFAHFSISSLCIYATRKGLVCCNRDTWYRYINKLGWKRPFRKKKRRVVRVGLRATKPDQFWHVDATHLKLLDGSKYFLQVLVDNYSRRVLAWLLSRQLRASNTAKLIKKAHRSRRNHRVSLISDGGSENVNKRVRSLIASSNPRIIHKIAKVDISNSNSMVERIFHALKNRHLCGQRLGTRRDLSCKIKFYFAEHNNVIPQTVLNGLTPAEAYVGDSAKELAVKMANISEKSRRKRLEQNRINICELCS